MVELKIEEQKKLMLEVLLDFDSICRSRDIKYSLAYGTLLGAIRHKGYIPWDDDIDVIVTRDDYTKLTKIANTLLKPNHTFINVETNQCFSAPLGKIIDNTTLLIQNGHFSDKVDLGVYIDVFVYDWIPTNIDKQRKVLSKAVLLQRIWSFLGNNYGNHNRIISLIRGMLNRTNFARKVSLYTNKWAQTVSKDREMMGSLLFGATNRVEETMKYSDFCDLVDYVFEGCHFLGIRNADYYLKQWYGDYMTLPPVENRVSNHATKVYKR
ncbi:MAG: LicD family protein [Spirochaetales bacterium]|nr:LicD family protein [Spirochaetales bacterium]